jgi:hypothetical protein
VNIFLVLIHTHRCRFLVCDVVGNHTLSGAHTYPDCRLCVRIKLKGLIPSDHTLTSLKAHPYVRYLTGSARSDKDMSVSLISFSLVSFVGNLQDSYFLRFVSVMTSPMTLYHSLSPIPN